MYGCELCHENKEKYLNVSNKIGSILLKYFSIYFDTIPGMGYLCEECWFYVESFHSFCVRIELTRQSVTKDENIVVQALDESLRILDPLQYENAYSIEEESIQEETSKEISEKVKAKRRNRKSSLNERKEEQENIQRNRLESLDREGDAYICDTCESKYVSSSEMYRHIKVTHELLQFRCKWITCVESFSTQNEIDIHTARMHPVQQCPYCDKYIADPYMEKHIKTAHDDSKKSMCDICGSLYKNAVALRKHMVSHSEQGLYECDICGAKLKTKATIRVHLQRHFPDAQKPHICSSCGEQFPTSRILHSHVLTRHNEPKFSCDVCGKKFFFKNKLEDHLNSHTGNIGNHICACSRRYRYASSYYFHRKNCAIALRPQSDDEDSE